MRFVAPLILAVLCCAAFPLCVAGQDDLPKLSDGYVVSPKADDQMSMAPEGYYGVSDIMTSHAVSSVPATAGKSFDLHMVMSNKVQKCPQADGAVEGDGELTFTADYRTSPPDLAYNNKQTGTTSNLHISMSAEANYKGHVDVNAMLKGPIDADVQYTHTATGSTREQSGALTSPTATHYSQHVTQQFGISKDGMPKLSDIHGGDPLEGGYAQAHAVTFILTYFGGIFYSAAQTNWTQPNECAHVVFNPPSKTRSPALGSDTKVTAEIKTKGGEGSRGSLSAQPHAGGGSVVAVDESTDPGSPAIFTYTAPNKKVDNGGFNVTGLSRAGAVNADWSTGLGTDWSGQIEFSVIRSGDAGNNDLQSWSASESSLTTINVTNGVAKASGYGELNVVSESRHYVVVNSSSHQEPDYSGNSQGSISGSSEAKIRVAFDTTRGTYDVIANYVPFPAGKRTTTSCSRGKCASEVFAYSLLSVSSGKDMSMSGKFSDINHVTGSKTDVTKGVGRSGKGTVTQTVTWDIARKGDTH